MAVCVPCVFLMVPWVGVHSVSVTFPVHTHFKLLFYVTTDGRLNAFTACYFLAAGFSNAHRVLIRSEQWCVIAGRLSFEEYDIRGPRGATGGPDPPPPRKVQVAIIIASRGRSVRPSKKKSYQLFPGYAHMQTTGKNVISSH